MKIQKTSKIILAGAIGLSASLSLTTAADAKTTYSVKSNKLYANGKLAKGTIVYKSKLYKNGKLAKGTTVYKSKLYKNGKLAKGTVVYKEKLYKNGTLTKGNVVYKSKLYKNGYLNIATTLYKDKLYKKGSLYKKATIYKSNYYINGILGKGMATYNSYLFADGIKYNGIYKERFYQEGAVFTGLSENVMYEDGTLKNGFVDGVLYIEGAENKGYIYFAGNYYQGSTLVTEKPTEPNPIEPTNPTEPTEPNPIEPTTPAPIEYKFYSKDGKLLSGEDARASMSSVDSALLNNYMMYLLDTTQSQDSLKENMKNVYNYICAVAYDASSNSSDFIRAHRAKDTVDAIAEQTGINDFTKEKSVADTLLATRKAEVGTYTLSDLNITFPTKTIDYGVLTQATALSTGPTFQFAAIDKVSGAEVRLESVKVTSRILYDENGFVKKGTYYTFANIETGGVAVAGRLVSKFTVQ